jgi:hypothetical protein
MSVEQTVGIISSLLDGRWLESDDAAHSALRGLGLTVLPGAGEELSGGLVQHEVTAPAGIDSASLTTAEGEPFSVILIVASVFEPQNATTIAAYRELLASLSETLGAPSQVWVDQPTPVHWHVGDLDVGAQLFDRRDSSVMVWVEHRARSQRAELRAH